MDSPAYNALVSGTVRYAVYCTGPSAFHWRKPPQTPALRSYSMSKGNCYLYNFGHQYHIRPRDSTHQGPQVPEQRSTIDLAA